MAGIAERPDVARILEGLSLGIKRQVVRAYCQVPPVEFIAGTTAENKTGLSYL